MTDSDSQKAICLPFSPLFHPCNCVCSPRIPRRTLSIFRSLSALVFSPQCLQFFQICGEEEKNSPSLEGVYICITFSFHYVSMQIYRDMTSIHSAEHFNLTEGKCQLPLTHLPFLDPLLQFQAHLW